MCGIFASFGKIKLYDAIECLGHLEYRGYDSAGVAYIDGDIKTNKALGATSNLINNIENKEVSSLISHTRWATNGVVNLDNTHPHSSLDREVYLVHNGILENEQELIDKYLSNISLKSDTDSEVIANLLSVFLKSSSPLEALKRLKEIMQGQYAIVVLICGVDGLFYLKKDMPLILAYDDIKNYYLTSDILSLPANTKRYAVLDDDTYGLINCDLNCDNFLFKSFFSNNEQLIKENRMIVEIKEELTLVDDLIKSIKEDEEALRPFLDETSEIVVLGAGSSYYAGLYACKIWERVLKKRISCFIASEFQFNESLYKENTLFLLISQSGETADLIASLSHIKWGKTILVTNKNDSTLARKVDIAFDIKAKTEIAVAATKSFNQTILWFYLLALTYTRQDYLEIQSYKKNIHYFINKIMEVSVKEKFFFLGSNFDFVAALEAALKLKEVTYIPSWGLALKELKHGPIALIDEDTTVYILNSDIDQNVNNTIQEIKARKGEVIVITPPFTSPYLGALSLITFSQLLAYHIAIKLGLNPDKPRNLAKSVTVL